MQLGQDKWEIAMDTRTMLQENALNENQVWYFKWRLHWGSIVLNQQTLSVKVVNEGQQTQKLLWSRNIKTKEKNPTDLWWAFGQKANRKTQAPNKFKAQQY